MGAILGHHGMLLGGAGGGGGAVPPLFSVLTGATPTYAYSLRNLGVSGYAGSAIRVRRSSDNAEQDIGFIGNDLDTASLLTFCGAGSGYVKTWYDQKGTSNWTQATAGAQPRIVNAGVLEVLTGTVPSMRFDGTDDIFIGSASTVAQPFTRVLVVKFLSVASGQNVNSDGVSSSLYFPSSGSLATYAGSSYTFKTGISVNDVATVFERLASNSVDGIYNGTGTNGFVGTASTLRQNLGGASSGGAGSSFTNMVASEFIFWPSQLSNPNQLILQTNQKAYWGTP